jgi:putative flippase GtrA
VLRFAITGGSGLIINLLLLAVLAEIGSVPQRLAAIVSTGLVLLGGFLLTDNWVFSEASTDKSTVTDRSLGYFVVMISGKLVNYVLFLVFLSIGVPYLLAWVLGSVLVFLLTFTGNRLFWYHRL